MRHSQRVRRGAVVALAVTLLALSGLSLLGTANTRQSAQTVAQSAALAEAYGRAHSAVAAAESLERKYRLEPGPEVRGLHRQAGEDLLTAVVEIRDRGGPADGAVADTLRALNATYQSAIASLFAAVDAGDVVTSLRIDNQQVDPIFGRMSDLVETTTQARSQSSAAAVEQLRRVESLVFLATIAGVAVGLCLIGAFAVVAVGYQRALLRQAQLSQHQALHDKLTGLPNRTLFADRLSQSLASSRRHGGSVAVMLLDLDRFKEVNDTLGHQYGDILLRQLGERVGEVLRASDTVARLSGDEFAVLLPDAGEADATGLAERILANVHRSFTLDDVVVDVEVSIGVAVAPGQADTAEALLRSADIAMYAAKDRKTGLEAYRPEMHVQDPTRLLLLGDLRRALDATDQLVLHYQPKVSLQLGQLCGVEALVRWHHPTRGLVGPDNFIPIAETTGLINRLTARVLELATQQVRSWLDQGIRVPVAVNLSPRCLLDTALVGHVVDLLEEFRLPASLLRLEVTETAIMANPALALATLTELHRLGIRLSIDDYGTGYSSMAYLKRLPVDELKVDRSFVLNMTRDDNDAVLVRSAVDLGHNLGLTVVAEGVETPEHVAALQDLGCDIAQGYHYARPMPPADFAGWLDKHQITALEPLLSDDVR